MKISRFLTELFKNRKGNVLYRPHCGVKCDVGKDNLGRSTVKSHERT